MLSLKEIRAARNAEKRSIDMVWTRLDAILSAVTGIAMAVSSVDRLADILLNTVLAPAGSRLETVAAFQSDMTNHC
jgi:hypothetical protein